MMPLPFDINSIPAMQPPPGVIPNFDNPESMHPYVLGVAIGTIAVMVIAISIRVYTKAFIMRDMKWEECTWHHLKHMIYNTLLTRHRLCHLGRGTFLSISQVVFINS